MTEPMPMAPSVSKCAAAVDCREQSSALRGGAQPSIDLASASAASGCSVVIARKMRRLKACLRPITRLGFGAWHKAMRELIPALTANLRYIRNRRQIVSFWPSGEVTLGPAVAIFAHYDRCGAVSKHVFHYLSELTANGLSVVFVSNAGQLEPDAVARLQHLCAAILVRRNIGYDFGAWREAMEHLSLPRSNSEVLVLANDSVYGPIRPLQETLARIHLDESPVWGLTESWQIDYHLQSYFLVFGTQALRSEAWRQFWDGVRPAPSKPWVIRHYEVGISQAMLRAGLGCRAAWPHGEIAGIPGSVEARSVNPTAHLWRPLLMNRFPFIKRELLLKNPAHIQDLVDWRAVAETNATIDIQPIVRDVLAAKTGGHDWNR